MLFKKIKNSIGRVLQMTPIINDHPRLLSRQEVVCRSVDKVVKHARLGVSHIKLKHILKYYGLDLDRFPATMADDILFVLSSEFVSKSSLDKLRKWLIAFHDTAVSVADWILMYEMLCFRGLYTLAFDFRELARVISLNPMLKDSKKLSQSSYAHIAAAVEGGECADASHLDDLMIKSGIVEEEANKWSLLRSLLYDATTSNYNAVLDGFSGFLLDKSVAVVGPSPTNAEDADEIDSFDLVLRLNYSYSGKGCDALHKGLRTDIACFNSEQASVLINEHNGTLPKEIKWACFKKDSLSDIVGALNQGCGCRSLVRFDDMNFHGGYNMMPWVVMDLCVNNAKRVKVFHTDLMLTQVRVKGYYPASFDRQDDMMNDLFRSSSIVHDPVLQYRVLCRLWSMGKIEGDARFNEVMMLGEKSYLEELEKVYCQCLVK